MLVYNWLDPERLFAELFIFRGNIYFSKFSFFLHFSLAKKVILNAQLRLSLSIRNEFKLIPWTTMAVTIRL